jgi:hypothetical protein
MKPTQILAELRLYTLQNLTDLPMCPSGAIHGDIGLVEITPAGMKGSVVGTANRRTGCGLIIWSCGEFLRKIQELRPINHAACV